MQHFVKRKIISAITIFRFWSAEHNFKQDKLLLYYMHKQKPIQIITNYFTKGCDEFTLSFLPIQLSNYPFEYFEMTKIKKIKKDLCKSNQMYKLILLCNHSL